MSDVGSQFEGFQVQNHKFHNIDVANTALLAVLGAIILMIPVLINGAPMIYFDSAIYLSRAEATFKTVAPFLSTGLFESEPAGGAGDLAAAGDTAELAAKKIVFAGRSLYYGIMALIGYKIAGLWTLVFIQATAFAYAGALMFRLLCPNLKAKHFFIVLALIAFLTPISAFVGLVMPDIWSGIGIMGIIALGFGWRSLTIVERVCTTLLIAMASLYHNSHLMLNVCFIGLFVICWLSNRYMRHMISMRGIFSSFAAVMIAICGIFTFYLAVKTTTGSAPVSLPYLTAHLVDRGVGTDYARTICAEDPKAYTLCKYEDRLPIHWGAFMFDLDQAKGVYAIASEVDQRAMSKEQMAFTIATIKYAPVETVRMFVVDAFSQIGMFKTDEVPLNSADADFIYGFFPQGVIDQITSSLSYDDKSGLRIITFLSYVSFGLSILMILYFCLRPGYGYGVTGGAATTPRQRAILIFCILAVLGNAVICGGLISPYDRFQARIIGIVPFVALLALLHVMMQSLQASGYIGHQRREFGQAGE